MRENQSDSAHDVRAKYGEMVLEGVVDKVKSGRGANYLARLHMRTKDGQLHTLENTLVFGSVADYLREGFQGKLYVAKPTSDNGSVIVGIETIDGHKIYDDKDRSRVVGLANAHGFFQGLMGLLGGALFSALVMVIITNTAPLAYYGIAAALGGVGLMWIATMETRSVKKIANYPGLKDFLLRNGFDAA